MAQAILMQGGGSGISSDDVTASKAQVLQGYSTVTTDSDDEVIEGTIKVVNTKDNDYMIMVVNSNSIYWDIQRQIMTVHLPFQNAYYFREDNSPHVSVKFDDLGMAQPWQVTNDATFTSKNGLKITGALVNRGGESPSLNVWWENGDLMTAFNEGVYGRHQDDTNDKWRWSPRVRLSGSHLGNANASYVHEGITFTSQHGLRLIGTMREWKPTARDIANAWNNETVVFDSYDSGYSGRKLLLKVPAWWRIGAVNWVGIAADNYRAENIRAGIVFPGGITGTMEHPEPLKNQLNSVKNDLANMTNARNSLSSQLDKARADYSRLNTNYNSLNNSYNALNEQLTNTRNELNGYKNTKVAFNNATFDGQLLSGVAEKGFNLGTSYLSDNYFLKVTDRAKYNGIYDGGLNILINATDMETYDALNNVGFTFRESINLKTYNLVEIEYKCDYHYTKDKPSTTSIDLDISVFLSQASTKGEDRHYITERTKQTYLSGTCGRILAQATDEKRHYELAHSGQARYIGDTGSILLNTTNINEPVFLSIGVKASGVTYRLSESNMFGRIIITKIKFIGD